MNENDEKDDVTLSGEAAVKVRIGVLVALLIEELENASQSDRCEFISQITSEYCEHCGSTDGHRCYCMRDD